MARAALVLCLAVVLGCAGTAERLVDRAGRSGEREAAERVDRGVSGAADAVEGAVTGGNAGSPSASGGSGSAADASGSAGAVGASGSTGPAATNEPPRAGEGADANYDFERGDRPLLLEDYSADNIGDFPRRFELGQGNWEVVEWDGRRLLRGTGGRYSDFTVPLPETLPERFTLEFEVMFTQVNQQIVVGTSPIADRSVQRHPAALVKVRNIETGLIMPTEKREFTSNVTGATMKIIDRPMPIRMMVDGEHVKVYAGGIRVANVPNATLDRSDRLHFMDIYLSNQEHPIFVGPIRVDAGGRDLYDELDRAGRVAIHGILFDTDSDRIRPESRPVLDEIGEMLQEHSDLRLSIEGHTDSQGAEMYNEELSQRRADAVRRWLIEEFGVDASRISAAGLGESRPVAANDTAEGRQQNRRVELVRVR